MRVGNAFDGSVYRPIRYHAKICEYCITLSMLLLMQGAHNDKDNTEFVMSCSGRDAICYGSYVSLGQ